MMMTCLCRRIPGYKHGNEQVLQVEGSLDFFQSLTKFAKAKAIIESAKKKAKEVRQSKGSGGRSVANSSIVSSALLLSTDLLKKSTAKRGRKSVKQRRGTRVEAHKLSLQSDTNGDITEAVKESECPSIQARIRVVPATPDSELPEGTVATAATGFWMLQRS
uniref:Uncharacterized protein n=1 Tax=Ditylenchus dipsaci TaxID=166011 RepID=A0A915DIU8_9BILA